MKTTRRISTSLLAICVGAIALGVSWLFPPFTEVGLPGGRARLRPDSTDPTRYALRYDRPLPSTAMSFWVVNDSVLVRQQIAIAAFTMTLAIVIRLCRSKNEEGK